MISARTPGQAQSNNRAPQGMPVALSCASVGNCAFGGAYTPRTDHAVQAFVDGEANGKLGKAQPVPGLAWLAKGASSYITVISCASAGNCTAGGWYGHPDRDQGGFVVSETDGVWGTAEPIPDTPAVGKFFAVAAISCASAGNCGLTGNYIASGTGSWITPFVASQVGGTWGDAQPVPGLAALDHGTGAMATTVSCPAPGECTAGGYYARTGTHRSVSPHAFTVTQTGGTWHAAQQVPGITALNTGHDASIQDVSCPPAGLCASAGSYQSRPDGNAQIFVVG